MERKLVLFISASGARLLSPIKYLPMWGSVMAFQNYQPASGFQVTIENECRNCIFADPSEIIAFFGELHRPGQVHFTYDVQNWWQMGIYPTLRVYEALRQLIGFFHLKEGQYGDNGTALEWKSALEDASWPVAEIVARRSPSFSCNG